MNSRKCTGDILHDPRPREDNQDASSRITIDMQDTEERQTITMLKGCLEQQKQYKRNAVKGD